jgi:AAA family ATP:ADP antiporter
MASIQAAQASLPNLHWLVPVVGNWSFSIFYILSELWGSVVLSMLFWQFANEITKVTEAKRFYGLFGMIGNIGLLLSGPIIILTAKYAKSLPQGIDSFGVNLKLLMSCVLVSGLIAILTYRWMNKNVLTDPKLYQPGQGKKKEKAKLSIVESFRYILKNPYLGLIAVLVLSYGIAINLVEGVWKGQIKIAFPDMNDYNMFMGQFSTWTGAVTILLMVVGNNVLRKLSWTKAAILTPIMVLVTSSIFFFFVWNGTKSSPFAPLMGTTVVLVAVLVGQIQNVLSKGTKYSLFDSTKQMAYIPLDQEAKVKGQGAVEVIGGRAGKSGGAFIQSTLLAVIGGSVSLASLTFILGPLVIVICGIWAFSVFGLGRRFSALVASKEAEKATETAPAATQPVGAKATAQIGN